MLNLVMLTYIAVLFYVLTPGMYVTFPSRSSKMVVTATHAVLFALVFKLTHKAVWNFSMRMDGFQDAAPNMPPMPNMGGMNKKEGFAKKKAAAHK